MTSLKWKIAKYLLFFGACLIGLNALFQIVLLEPMYENSKINTVKKASNDIVSSIEEDNLTDMMYRVSAENDLCIRIYSENSSIYAGNMGCVLYRMSDVELVKEISKARQNNNTYISTKAESFDGSKDSIIKDITYTRIVDDSDSTYIVMVNTSITPVDATVSTLTNQLWMISVFVLIVVAILVLVMNRNIAAPLTTLNNSAKLLSKGTYTYDDKVNAYQEVYELNETLKKAAVDIQKADQAKRDLIANVSHDLRTPLTMISGYGEMMKDLPGEKTDENCQVIIDEAKRLTYLVNDLLDLSKLEEKKIVLEESVFDLSSLVQREIRKYEIYAVQTGYKFTVDAKENLFVKADEKRIEQVFNNFITNAINYSNENKDIEIRVYQKDKNIRLEVEDHGIGISKEDQQIIFDKFERASASKRTFSKGGAPGFGLGLNYVLHVIEAHGGMVSVDSELGKYTEFTIFLPDQNDSYGGRRRIR